MTAIHSKGKRQSMIRTVTRLPKRLGGICNSKMFANQTQDANKLERPDRETLRIRSSAASSYAPNAVRVLKTLPRALNSTNTNYTFSREKFLNPQLVTVPQKLFTRQKA